MMVVVVAVAAVVGISNGDQWQWGYNCKWGHIPGTIYLSP